MRYFLYKSIYRVIYIVFLAINVIISINDFELGLTVFSIGMLVLIPVEFFIWYFVKVKDIFHLKEAEDEIYDFKYTKENRSK